MINVKPYNIIYIHTHDSGKVFSPYGFMAPSPNLQSFADDSILFRNAFCASPTCSPSRSALLTGMYPHSCGMLGLSNRGFEIKDYSWHLVTALKNHGLRTVLCGIQHETDHYLNHEAGARTIGYDEDITSDKNLKEMEDPTLWDYDNAKRASEWISKFGASKQFFMSFGMFSTHRKYPETNVAKMNPDRVLPPYPVPDNATTREDFAQHLLSVEHADNCFAMVVDALKKAGIYDNSIIIFTTDHGIPFPYSKCTLYDSGIGVALMMRVPENNSKGKAVDNLVSQVDIYPTLCDLLGIAKPDRLQGVSFANYFSGDLTPHRDKAFAEINFHTSFEPVRCVRTERYKYIKYFDQEYLKINISNIDESPAKKLLLENGLEEQRKSYEALYDLLYDPGERNNLAEDAAGSHILNEMRLSLNEWQRETEDPMLCGEIPRKKEWKVNKRTSKKPSSQDPADYEDFGN